MYIGQALKRDEDYRFLKGRGRYTSDLEQANMAHAVFLHSPHAHARIKNLSTARAEAMPGVLAVLTAKDWDAEGFGDTPLGQQVYFIDGRPMNAVMRPVFARDKVCFVGDSIAAVIADTVDQARDAVEAIDVEYEPLPSIRGTAHAVDPDAPILHEEFGTNIVVDGEHGDRAAAEEAFKNAHHVTEISVVNTRITGNPMEPRMYVGQYDDIADHYTMWGTIQIPHWLRNWIAKGCLKVPYHKIRVVGPDVGGGFGTKCFFYPEMPVVLYGSKRVGRPVRWVSTRSEGLATDCHARDHVTKAKMAFDKDGLILGLMAETVASNGAYQGNFTASISAVYYPPTITGLYKTPAVHVKVTGVYTHGSPTDAYRGSGRPEATFVNERLLENGARELGIDPAEIRLRNYIQPDEYPYMTPLGRKYDCGNPAGQHDIMMKLSNYEGLKTEREKLRAKGIRMGIGLAGFTETAGIGPSRQSRAAGFSQSTTESATVRVHQDGKVTILSGSFAHGQGHYTTFRQVAADYLGLPMEDIDLIQGDTDKVPTGSGTWGARSLVTGGMAIVVACEKVIAKSTKLAAHILECAEADIEYANATFSVKGTDRNISFAEIAESAYLGGNYPEEGFELGLEESSFFDPIDMTTPTGLHLAVVLVDDETGKVTLRNFYSVDDCGRIINPMIVAGQVHGGIAQGFGQAMCEHVIYDSDSGQLLTGSFMDYGMPRAPDLPSFDLEFQETLNPSNALGAKGGSETGVIGPPAAIGNAIVDALWNLGVRHVDMPYTPDRVWQAIQAAKAAAA